MSDNDFKKLVGKVKRIKSPQISSEFKTSINDANQKRIQKQKKDHAAVGLLCQLDSPMVTSEEMIAFIQSGYSKKILKNLKKEIYPVVLEIDLHHMTEKQAKQYLLKTLDELNYSFPASIRIIHGKSCSAGRAVKYPVLKNMVVQVLSNHCKVVAYTSCVLSNGGAGATLVLLGADKL